MEYNSDYSASHKDHGPMFTDPDGNRVLEHSYIPHKKELPPPPPHVADQALSFEDVPGEVAHLMMLVALFIYCYTLVGCYIFEPCFIRKLAYTLQSFRLAMLLFSILPCVVHWQAFTIFPNISAREFPYVVTTLLAGNVALSKLAEKILSDITARYPGGQPDGADEKEGLDWLLSTLFNGKEDEEEEWEERNCEGEESKRKKKKKEKKCGRKKRETAC